VMIKTNRVGDYDDRTMMMMIKIMMIRVRI